MVVTLALSLLPSLGLTENRPAESRVSDLRRPVDSGQWEKIWDDYRENSFAPAQRPRFRPLGPGPGPGQLEAGC